jgi:hypothetical protein
MKGIAYKRGTTVAVFIFKQIHVRGVTPLNKDIFFITEGGGYQGQIQDFKLGGGT